MCQICLFLAILKRDLFRGKVRFGTLLNLTETPVFFETELSESPQCWVGQEERYRAIEFLLEKSNEPRVATDPLVNVNYEWLSDRGLHLAGDKNEKNPTDRGTSAKQNHFRGVAKIPELGRKMHRDIVFRKWNVVMPVIFLVSGQIHYV